MMEGNSSDTIDNQQNENILSIHDYANNASMDILICVTEKDDNVVNVTKTSVKKAEVKHESKKEDRVDIGCRDPFGDVDMHKPDVKDEYEISYQKTGVFIQNDQLKQEPVEEDRCDIGYPVPYSDIEVHEPDIKVEYERTNNGIVASTSSSHAEGPNDQTHPNETNSKNVHRANNKGPNKRSKQFSAHDIRHIIELIEENTIILSKKTDMASNSAKEAAWSRLAARYNALSRHPRNVSHLKLKWDNMKKAAKKRAAMITNANRDTGDGPFQIFEDPILDKVIALNKITCCGIGSPLQSDVQTTQEIDLEVLTDPLQLREDSQNGNITQETQNSPSPLPKDDGEASCSKCKTCTPASLKTPVSKKLKKKSNLTELEISKINRNNAITKYYEYKLSLLQKENA